MSEQQKQPGYRSLFRPAGSAIRRTMRLCVLGLALCLAGCPGEDTPKYSLKDVYPTVAEQAEKYRPVFTEAEEAAWMDAPGFPVLFKGDSSLHVFGGQWYPYCMDEALRGNPRGMACLYVILSYSGRDPAELEKRGDPAAKAHNRDYWLAMANRYMPGGWVWNRIGDLEGAQGYRCDAYARAYDQGNLEAGFLLEKHMCGQPVKNVLECARKGDYGAMGLLAEHLAKGAYRVDLMQPDLPLAREYALRSAYACTEEGGANSQPLLRRRGSAH